MDPEYSVIGRVARRIWAVAMKNKYGANERSQKLKYHVQTSGRSLHAQEMAFNDIRTTLQALCAIYDNCNSLHTNAYDEAITTPTEESVRRAMAIQMIINREWGLAKSENPQPGQLHHRGADRPGRGGGAEGIRARSRAAAACSARWRPATSAARSRKNRCTTNSSKHDGSLPIIGVNTFRNPHGDGVPRLARTRAFDRGGKADPVRRLHEFQRRHADEAPAMLERLRRAVIEDEQHLRGADGRGARLLAGQITHALYEVGGRYRRNM